MKNSRKFSIFFRRPCHGVVTYRTFFENIIFLENPRVWEPAELLWGLAKFWVFSRMLREILRRDQGDFQTFLDLPRSRSCEILSLFRTHHEIYPGLFKRLYLQRSEILTYLQHPVGGRESWDSHFLQTYKHHELASCTRRSLASPERVWKFGVRENFQFFVGFYRNFP